MNRLYLLALTAVMASIAMGLFMRAPLTEDPAAIMTQQADTHVSLEQTSDRLPTSDSKVSLINRSDDSVSIADQFATAAPGQAIASQSSSIEWSSQTVNFLSDPASPKKSANERETIPQVTTIPTVVNQRSAIQQPKTQTIPSGKAQDTRHQLSRDDTGLAISRLPEFGGAPSPTPVANPFFESTNQSTRNTSTNAPTSSVADTAFLKIPTGAITISNLAGDTPSLPGLKTTPTAPRPTIVTNDFAPAETESIPELSLSDSTTNVSSIDNRVASLAMLPKPAPKPALNSPSPANRPPSNAPPKPSESPATDTQTPGVLMGASSFKLAAQPELGDHWHDDRPVVDSRAVLTPTITEDFSPDAVDEFLPYDPYHQMHIYEGKTLNANQRPLLELGRPWYQLGQLSPSSNILGKHNPLTPQFLIYGDYRSAFASNTQAGNNVTQSASELNLDFDLKLTGTERFHMFMSPLDNGTTNTGYLFDEDRFVSQFDANIDFGYFEGDLGAIVGGITNKTLPFDFPFAIGVMPLLLQNGIWMDDAFLGVAATIPARNSAMLNISNMDTTFFAGYDKITTPAFADDDSAARMYGMASFIEALNGYIEIDYAFLDDRTFDDRSYHNIGIGYTRRYGRFLSNSTRLIMNAGQSTDVVENTADGFLLLSENSLITGAPSTVVPYLNFFAGFDRPQSAARAAQAGGILRNTGILFESDGMTNYPTLDPTANDTLGGALGLNLLANDFSQQLVVELAWLNVMGDDVNRNAAGNQYGAGARYQLPLTNALIFRADAMVGFLEDAADVHGVRMELRHKW